MITVQIEAESDSTGGYFRARLAGTELRGQWMRSASTAVASLLALISTVLTDKDRLAAAEMYGRAVKLAPVDAPAPSPGVS